MRRIILCIFLFPLSACVAWWSSDEPSNPDPNIYAKRLSSNSGQIFLGIVAHPAPPEIFDIGRCFDQDRWPHRSWLLARTAFGAYPLDAVCSQYEGVDLTEYGAEYLQCFGTAKINGETLYTHPWVTKNPPPHCQQLLKSIKR